MNCLIILLYLMNLKHLDTFPSEDLFLIVVVVSLIFFEPSRNYEISCHESG